MAAIFISHSSKDNAVAAKINEWLETQKYERVFLDFDDSKGIGWGEDWEKRLYEELTRCQVVLLVLTPSWLDSKWCVVELAQARALGKVIIPILCEPIGTLTVLPQIQAADLLNWNETGLSRLRNTLESITSEIARGFKFDSDRSPYPGIYAFEIQDAAIYFGRDDETHAIVEKLEARRTRGGEQLLIIIGASGSGKSSLLKAGVLPQLGRREERWVLLPLMRPQKTPMEDFAKAIAQYLGNSEGWRDWKEKLSGADAAKHVEALVKDLRVGTARGAMVLLPIDQFEEMYTIADPEERDAFQRLLSTILDRKKQLPIMVVATGRSDVLEDLLATSSLVGAYETYPLARMPLDRIESLIKGPASVASISVEDGLSKRIEHDVEDADALPLLALTLSLLYQAGIGKRRLTIADYESLGDPKVGHNPIQNAVRRVANDAIARVAPSEQQLAALRDAFVPHLVRVRLEDDKRVRQTALMSELPPDSISLIEALRDARLLSTHEASAKDSNGRIQTVIEVAHESLFKAWQMLDQWLTEEYSFLSDLERLKTAHDVWIKAAENQRASALLGGLLLSRARDWLVKYPQRFLSPNMKILALFITASAVAADADEERKRRMQRLLVRGAIVAATVFAALALTSIGALYFAEIQRNDALIAQSHYLAGESRGLTAAGNNTLGMIRALDALPVAIDRPDRPFVRDAEYALEDAFANRREQSVLQGHTEAIWSVAFSSDGKRLVTASSDGTARLWSSETDSQIGAALSGHRGVVWYAAFSPDGKRVVTASADKTARLWDGASGAPLFVLAGHDEAVSFAAFSSDSSRVVTASDDHTARIWDANTGSLIAVLKGHTGTVNAAVFSPDGTRVATASSDMTARLWDSETGVQIGSPLLGHTDFVWSVGFSPDGNHLVTASKDQTARIWDVHTGAQEKLPLKGHEGWVLSAAFSPDGTHVVTSSVDHTARIWDANTDTVVRVLQGHQDWVNSASYSADGTRIVTASNDATARLWDANSGFALAILRGHSGNVYSAVFSADGRTVATVSHDRTLRFWNTEAADARLAMPHPSIVEFAAFSPDGKHVVTASDDAIGRIWDIGTGKLLTVLKGHAMRLNTAEYSRDGTRIVTASTDGTARIWDAQTGAQIGEIKGSGAGLWSAAFSPDGMRIATASTDKNVRLWDVASGALVALLVHENVVTSVNFSPDGKRLVTASWDNTARVWDAHTYGLMATLKGHASRVNSAVFSPDGTRVVTTSADHTARVWNADTAAQIAVLNDNEGTMAYAEFSPDGRRVVTASGGGHVARIWDAKTGAPISVLRGHQNWVNSAAFSPDAKIVVTASSDTTARLWRMPTHCEGLIASVAAEQPVMQTRSDALQTELDSRPKGGGLIATANRWIASLLNADEACY